MNKSAVLVVDDDPSIRKFISANLTARKYEVKIARDGIEALDMFSDDMFDLVILDIMMPGIDGFEVCRRIREKSDVAIVMLSAKDGESDKVRCLELGADDYMTKPFSLTELLLRVQAVLRRTHQTESITISNFRKGGLEVDYAADRVFVNGREVEMTTIEYRLLRYLTMNSGRIVSPRHILEKVWGQEYIDNPRVLWVNLSRLRHKLINLDPDLDIIQTRPGMGYVVK